MAKLRPISLFGPPFFLLLHARAHTHTQLVISQHTFEMDLIFFYHVFKSSLILYFSINFSPVRVREVTPSHSCYKSLPLQLLNVPRQWAAFWSLFLTKRRKETQPTKALCAEKQIFIIAVSFDKCCAHFYLFIYLFLGGVVQHFAKVDTETGKTGNARRKCHWSEHEPSPRCASLSSSRSGQLKGDEAASLWVHLDSDSHPLQLNPQSQRGKTAHHWAEDSSTGGANAPCQPDEGARGAKESAPAARTDLIQPHVCVAAGSVCCSSLHCVDSCELAAGGNIQSYSVNNTLHVLNTVFITWRLCSLENLQSKGTLAPGRCFVCLLRLMSCCVYNQICK